MRYPIIFVLALIGVRAYASKAVDYSAYAIYDVNFYRGSLFDELERNPGEEDYLRSLKLSADVDVTKALEFDFSIEYDSDKGRFELDDAYFSYDLAGNWQLNAGHFKEPVGLETQQSKRKQFLFERSVISNAMALGRHWGIGLDWSKKYLYMQSSVFYLPKEDDDYKNGMSSSLRLVVTPVQREAAFLHLGLNYGARDVTDNNYRLKETPIAYGTEVSVKSAKYDPTAIHIAAGEIAAQIRPLIVQSEYFIQRLRLEDGQKVDFTGYYITTSLTLFGNYREYDEGDIWLKKGVKHTLELAHRYSYANFTGGVKADAVEVNELALNYYLKSDMRLSISYQNAEKSDWSDKGGLTQTEGRSFNARAQFVWN